MHVNSGIVHRPFSLLFQFILTRTLILMDRGVLHSPYFYKNCAQDSGNLHENLVIGILVMIQSEGTGHSTTM